MLKEAHNPYILACHLQIDADPVRIQLITLMRMRTDRDLYLYLMRIQVTIHADPDSMPIQIHNTTQISVLDPYVFRTSRIQIRHYKQKNC